jgi:hypothetical protein
MPYVSYHAWARSNPRIAGGRTVLERRWLVVAHCDMQVLVTEIDRISQEKPPDVYHLPGLG